MFEIINQQRKIKIDPQDFKSFIRNSLSEIPETNGKILTIAFVSDKKIRELNNQYRNKNSVTDVLSFIYEGDEFEADENYLGDIVISAEQAKKQALENDLNLDLEIKQLILHGILHLCGYDHETDKGEMNELELKLRDKLEISG